jgi:hypothetical protein
MSVNIECLRGPEHQYREEVRSRDEGDDERQAEDAGLLSQSLWEHGMFRAPALPNNERNNQDHAQDERRKDVGA